MSEQTEGAEVGALAELIHALADEYGHVSAIPVERLREAIARAAARGVEGGGL